MNPFADIISAHQLELSGDPDDALAIRLRAKLEAECTAFEQEKAERAQLHNHYMAVARQKRDHITDSKHRIETSGLSPDELSDAALARVSAKLKTITPEELGRLFGPKSSAKEAAQLAAGNSILYSTLRELAKDRGL